MSTKIELTSKKNADLARWQWSDERKQEWKEPEPAIREFYNKWRDPSKTALSREVNIGHIPEFERAPKRFLVRDCYKTTFDQVWQRAFVRPETGVVLTGQPGIGKTYFLWYILIRLIRQGQPVAFSTEGTVYLFYNNGVWVQKTASTIRFPIAKPVSDPTEHMPVLFVLIDHDVSTSEPHSVLHSPEGVFPIQASSSNPHHFTRWAKRRKAGIWGLPLWEEAELNMAFPLQSGYLKFKVSLEEGTSMCSKSKGLDPEGSEETSSEVQAALETLKKWSDKKNRLLKDLKTDDDSCESKDIEKEEDNIYAIDMTSIDGTLKVLVHAAMQNVGPVARDVFEYIFYPTAAAEDQAEAIATVTYDDLQQLSKSFQADHTFPHRTITHRIIVVIPIPPSPDDPTAYERLRDKWRIDYRSVQLAREMAEKLEEEKDDRLAYFFEFFRSSPQSSTLASWIHEHIAHRTLRTHARQELGLFKMEGKVENSTDAPVVIVDFEKGTASKERLPGGDRRHLCFQGPGIANLTDEGYYVPQRSNFPLFDSFLVEKREDKVVLWVFQMSISRIHGGSRKGYASIRRIIESLNNPSSDDGDNRKAKRQKLAVTVIVKYVYVVPWEDDRTKFEWHCPPGWNNHNKRYNHQGSFYGLRMPIRPGTGAKY